MATIKLKSSTGTRTVPSSLAQGEMAINVADGNLFYGDNSSNVNNDFRFAQVGVTGLTSGHTIHGYTLSGGSGGIYGTIRTGTQAGITTVGTLVAGQLGTDAAPLTAFINSGEIDGVTIGSETRAVSIKSQVLILEPQDAGQTALTIKGPAEAEGNWVTVTNAGNDVMFKISNEGKTTIADSVLTTTVINAGTIDNTIIGASTPSSIVSTSTKATNLSGSTGEIRNDLMVSGSTYITTLNISGTTRLTEGGTAFTPRPNIYWFGNCDAETYSPASDGSFPSTNVTDVSWSQTHNSHASVYSAATDQLQIIRAGLYKFTYNVTLETGADGSASNRTGGGIALLRKAAGGTYAVVDGTESYTYNRMASPQTEKNGGAASVIYSVTANDVFKVVFIRTGASNAASKLGTIRPGTAWTVEAIT